VLGRLFLLFTLVPLLELWLLLRIGAWVGLLPTLALVVATGMAGAWLARREGTRCWAAVQSELAAGHVPGEQLLHALLVFAAGLLLVTPGVLTDVTGLLLLVRPTRRAAVRALRRRLEAGVRRGSVRIFSAGMGRASGPGAGGGGPDAPRRGGAGERPGDGAGERPGRSAAHGRGGDPGRREDGHSRTGGRVIEM